MDSSVSTSAGPVLPDSVSSDLSHLVNLGVVDFSGPSSPVRGLLICGLPRSGTTAFAKALAQLGFDLGRASEAPVAELASLHPPLKAALQGGAAEGMRLVEALEGEVSALSAVSPRFAIKLPDYYRVLNHQRMPQGIDLILFVTRDPICVAVRNSKSVHMDVQAAIRRAVKDYGEMVDVASACSCPSLLVSYEKLLAMPAELLPVLARRLGLEPDPARLEAAIGALVLNDQRYLSSSSLERGTFRGQIGYFSGSRIGGWCFWDGMPSKAITMEVRSPRGVVLGRGQARVMRPNLLEEGLHPTGKAGFQIDLDQALPLKKLSFFADGIAVALAPTPQLKKRLRRAAAG